MSDFPRNNRTWQIINAAAQGNYAVGGYCVYNIDGVLAVLRAASRTKSPAIIQVFPWTLHFHGPAFISYIHSLCSASSVPVSVHLDHCLKPEDAKLALSCAFDSIMVDGSLFDEEESVKYVRGVVEKARDRGITVEAELGRVVGGEDGVDLGGIESALTDPSGVAEWVKKTGVHFLAPSFGNVHGPYPAGGAEKWWQVDRLNAIYSTLGPGVPLVLHGTHPCSDEMLRVGIQNGMRKVNQNRTVRTKYMKFLAEESGSLELTALQEKGVQIYSEEIESMMHVLGSAGKA